MKKRLYFR